MKWACIILVILDLILVGGAAFRFLTVPKAEVQKYVNIYEGNASKNSTSADDHHSTTHSHSTSSSGSSESPAKEIHIEFTDETPGTKSPESKPTVMQMIENKKPTEMNEDSIFTYDDQATKQQGLDESKKKMRAVFRTSP